MNVLERVMGWIRPKPVPYDADIEAAYLRLVKLEAAEARRKALALRVDARRRPAR